MVEQFGDNSPNDTLINELQVAVNYLYHKWYDDIS